MEEEAGGLREQMTSQRNRIREYGDSVALQLACMATVTEDLGKAPHHWKSR
jgi:hypothetical protein